MNTKLVLDTSAVLAFFHGCGATRDAMNRASIVYLPSIAAGELYFGALRCSRPTQEEAKIEALIIRTQPLLVDYATVRIYSAVINQLELEGRRIPINVLLPFQGRRPRSRMRKRSRDNDHRPGP